jgi:alpha-L-fucosidase 2
MSELKSAILAFLLLVANFLFAQDLTLWYDKPAQKWVEALPIGNGRLGAIVFGGIASDRIQFNEETLWTGYPRDYNRQGAYKYLDSIRNLLFQGKQKEAEYLAGREFMGLKSAEGDREAWIKKALATTKERGNPSQENYNDEKWATIKMPTYDGWEAIGHEGLDGAVWFRTRFHLPDEWLGKNLILDLNKLYNQDYTYVNGVLVGSKNDDETRKYIINKNALKQGENTIAILVLNFSGKGGILGYKDPSKPIGLYPEGVDEASKISLNGLWKFFVQNDDVPAIGQYQASYQPFGDLFLNFNVDESKVSNYKRMLDLSNAVASTTFNYNGVQYKREYIASVSANAIIVHLTAEKRKAIGFEALINSPHSKFQVQKLTNNTLLLSIQVKDGASKGKALLKVILKGGVINNSSKKIIVHAADEATLFLYAATNFINYAKVAEKAEIPGLKGILNQNSFSFNKLKDAHIKEYKKYFDTYSIQFFNSTKQNFSNLTTDKRLEQFAFNNDPSFVALYAQYGRYLLISSSRPGTRPANLQGIWNDLLAPPWGSKYTTNINLEMNYWPAELLNLSPMHQPLFQMINDLSKTGSETAKQYYNASGWVLHHNTDLWRGAAPINASNHGIWPTGGAWLCQHLWEHFLFNRNLKFLRNNAYPLMKASALFFNSVLVKDPKTGWLISTPSNSPEQGGLVAGPTMDHQIIRALFKNTIEASEILNTDAGFRKELKDKYSTIAPNQIGKYGQLQEWLQDVDDTTNKHRHVSHLWAVYPGNEINWEDTPDLMQAARQSLIYRGDEATGWSLGWKINLWARFKDAGYTYKLIQMLLSPARGGAGSYPNLFDAHPPFQIDGNFGGAAGINELLIQSHTQYIDILPALPDNLANGEVKGVKVRGGFEVDMKWENGYLQTLTIRSLVGEEMILRYRNKIVKIPTVKNGVYKLNGNLEEK